MPVEQYDEIVNLKRDKVESAGIAIRRIEWFQKGGLLTIESLGVTSKPKAYADAYFIKLFIEKSRENTIATMVTLDRDLRVRLRGMSEINCRFLEIPERILSMYENSFYNFNAGWFPDDERDRLPFYPNNINRFMSIFERTHCVPKSTNTRWVEFLKYNPYSVLLRQSKP